MCDRTVASLAARRENVLASKCEHPPFLQPLLNPPEGKGQVKSSNASWGSLHGAASLKVEKAHLAA